MMYIYSLIIIVLTSLTKVGVSQDSDDEGSGEEPTVPVPVPVTTVSPYPTLISVGTIAPNPPLTSVVPPNGNAIILPRIPVVLQPPSTIRPVPNEAINLAQPANLPGEMKCFEIRLKGISDWGKRLSNTEAFINARFRSMEATFNSFMFEKEARRIYSEYGTQINYNRAVKLCQSQGMRLVSIDKATQEGVFNLEDIADETKKFWIHSTKFPKTKIWQQSNGKILPDKYTEGVSLLDTMTDTDELCLVFDVDLGKVEKQLCKDDADVLCETPEGVYEEYVLTSKARLTMQRIRKLNIKYRFEQLIKEFAESEITQPPVPVKSYILIEQMLALNLGGNIVADRSAPNIDPNTLSIVPLALESKVSDLRQESFRLYQFLTTPLSTSIKNYFWFLRSPEITLARRDSKDLLVCDLYTEGDMPPSSLKNSPLSNYIGSSTDLDESTREFRKTAFVVDVIEGTLAILSVIIAASALAFAKGKKYYKKYIKKVFASEVRHPDETIELESQPLKPSRTRSLSPGPSRRSSLRQSSRREQKVTFKPTKRKSKSKKAVTKHSKEEEKGKRIWGSMLSLNSSSTSSSSSNSA